jgi:hypothetical protein
MSRPAVGGWLRGTAVRKGGGASGAGSRQGTPQVKSTSSTIFGGGVKDPSGRTAEFFVSAPRRVCVCVCSAVGSRQTTTSAPYASRTAS